MIMGLKKNRFLRLILNSLIFFDIKDYISLTDYVIEWSKEKSEPLYLLLDEVGRIFEWEKAVNAFHAMNIFDIYITGSNADLLSSDISTYLAGRYIEIHIFTFSYKVFRHFILIPDLKTI